MLGQTIICSGFCHWTGGEGVGGAADQPLHRKSLPQRLHQDDPFFLSDREQQSGLVCFLSYLLSLRLRCQLWRGARLPRAHVRGTTAWATSITRRLGLRVRGAPQGTERDCAAIVVPSPLLVVPPYGPVHRFKPAV